jgi:hypothetical protein
MKHWDGRDRDDVVELRLPQSDRARLAEMLSQPVRPRRQPLQVHSVIGLALALGMLVALAMLLSPSDPVSSKLVN